MTFVLNRSLLNDLLAKLALKHVDINENDVAELKSELLNRAPTLASAPTFPAHICGKTVAPSISPKSASATTATKTTINKVHYPPKTEPVIVYCNHACHIHKVAQPRQNDSDGAT